MIKFSSSGDFKPFVIVIAVVEMVYPVFLLRYAEMKREMVDWLLGVFFEGLTQR